MTEPIGFFLDGAEVEATPGETIWQVASRRGIEIPNDPFIVIDDFGHAQRCDCGWIAAEFVDVDIHAGPALRDYVEALLRIVRHPVFPAAGSHP